MSAGMDKQRPMFSKMRQRLNELYEQHTRLVFALKTNTRKQLEVMGSMPTQVHGNRKAFVEAQEVLQNMYKQLKLERLGLMQKYAELQEQDTHVLLRLVELGKPDLEFKMENESLCKKFGTIQSIVDSVHFLDRHPNLVCDEAARCLIEWGVRLEMHEQSHLARCLAHQSVCLQYILELGQQLNTSPAKCTSKFFENIHNSSLKYQAQFLRDIQILSEYIARWSCSQPNKYLNRIIDVTLNPFQVIHNLPEEIRICFVQQSIKSLHHILLTKPSEEALYHIKRCINIGIWDPSGNNKHIQTHRVHESPDNSQRPNTKRRNRLAEARIQQPMVTAPHTDRISPNIPCDYTPRVRTTQRRYEGAASLLQQHQHQHSRVMTPNINEQETLNSSHLLSNQQEPADVQNILPIQMQRQQQQQQQTISEVGIIRKCDKELQTNPGIFVPCNMDSLSNQYEGQETFQRNQNSNLSKWSTEEKTSSNQTNTNTKCTSCLYESVLRNTEFSHRYMTEKEMNRTSPARYQHRFGDY